MKVSFIIPLYNCLPLTQAMLASLQATVPPGLAHEIILVDDGSTDGTRDWLKTLPAPCRHLLNERNAGFATTCNRGADIASGELLFFLNNDLVLLPGWFEPMRDLLHEPRVGLVGNIQLDARTGATDHAGVYFDHKCKPRHITVRPRLTGWSGRREIVAVTAACVGLRREVWRQIGGFDPLFRNGCEDVDLCLRARAAGFHNLVAARSVVRHHVSASPGRHLRNEHNASLLVERWSQTILQLAARPWCRHFIADQADRSHGLDHPLLCAALAHLVLLRHPPAAVRAGVAAALEVERQRWRELLDGAPPPPPLPSGRTDQI